MRPSQMSRRGFLGAAGSLGLLALVPAGRLNALLDAVAAPGQPGRFLTAHELDTLRAVTARLVPGPPDDPDPGGLEARAAEAIDLLLGAFEVDPPMIHAGGPFSNRAGSAHDDFADFVALDAHAELGWRIRLEGSKGLPEREFAGPVRGLQQVYREGLAHLDSRAPGGSFSALPGPAQDLILSDQSDDQVQELLGAALANTLDAVYGAPEYGGNRNLVGWGYTHWDGDTQPRGFTNSQVSDPGTAGGAPKMSAKQFAALERFMPALAGKRASRDAFWMRRAGLTGR
ncbi:MAG: gluconate 2-dehydrogenase subunit 3 family protein [Thermoleophilaceae bacterium]